MEYWPVAKFLQNRQLPMFHLQRFEQLVAIPLMYCLDRLVRARFVDELGVVDGFRRRWSGVGQEFWT